MTQRQRGTSPEAQHRSLLHLSSPRGFPLSVEPRFLADTQLEKQTSAGPVDG